MPKIIQRIVVTLILIINFGGCGKIENKGNAPNGDIELNNTIANMTNSTPYYESWSEALCKEYTVLKVKSTNFALKSDSEFNEFSIAAISCADNYYTRDEFYWLSILISKEEMRRGNNEAKFALYLDQYCQENVAGRTKQRIAAFNALRKYVNVNARDIEVLERFKRIEKDFARQAKPNTCTKNDCSQFPEEKVCYK